VISQIYIGGIPTFKRPARQYEYPILVVGAGLGGIQLMIELQRRGRTDIVCVDRNCDWGGDSWTHVPNKFTKLQTERGTYHVDYIKPEAPVPRRIRGTNGIEFDYKTWPSRDSLLRMMRASAAENGLNEYVMWNVEVQKVAPKKGAYAATYTPFYFGVDEGDGDAEVLFVSHVSVWPGFLHEANQVDFQGEAAFGGYIEYSSFDKVDYAKTTGHTVVLYGHGAFAIENVRTLCEWRCKKVYVLCRTRNLSGTKMASWLVSVMDRPLPAQILVDALQKMYNLVGFDCWTAHSVQADATKKNCMIVQKTIFGVTDIYFLAGYFGLMECVVSEIKRITDHCVHTKNYLKIQCEVIIKAIGTRPSFKVDRQFGIKEVVGSWINGDPHRWVNLGMKGVQAKNFGSFSVGPGFAPMMKMASYFIDYPDDWAMVADSLPRNKAGQWPAYVTPAAYGTPMFMLMSRTFPILAAQMNEMSALKPRKQAEAHPLEEYLAEVTAEWNNYIKYFRKHGLVDDRPDPPYPYTPEIIYEMVFKAQKINNGEEVEFEVNTTELTKSLQVESHPEGE
jgi:hypothetical protein